MKRAILMVLTLAAGCGYSSVDSGRIDQPKKLFRRSPTVCSEPAQGVV